METTTSQLIAKHERCIEILIAIGIWERQRQMTQETNKGISGQFPALVAKNNHRIEIYSRAIARMNKKYLAVLQG